MLSELYAERTVMYLEVPSASAPSPWWNSRNVQRWLSTSFNNCNGRFGIPLKDFSCNRNVERPILVLQLLFWLRVVSRLKTYLHWSLLSFSSECMKLFLILALRDFSANAQHVGNNTFYWASLNDYPKCKYVVVTSCRKWLLTRIDSQGSSEKKSRQI